MKARILLAVAAITALVINADLASAQILQGKSVLFVGGGDPDPTGGDDAFIFDHLEDLGAEVTYLSGDASTPDDGEEADLIIISSTLGSGTVRGKFQDLATPILNWEEALMDGNTAGGNFSMGSASQNGSANPGTEIEIIDPSHPLAGGLSGVVEFAEIDINRPYIEGQIGPGVLAIASLPTAGDDVVLSPSGNGMHLGTTQNATNPFIGLLDEMAVWDQALSFEVDANSNLTGGQVNTVYSQGISSLTNATPIGYWSFDDQSDETIAVDDSGNGNDADLFDVAYSNESAPNVGGTGSLEMIDLGSADVPFIERPGGELAYSFWFNADSAEYGETFDTADPRVDFYYGNGDGGTVRPHLSANRNGRPVGLYVNADGDVATPFEATVDAFSTDEWHHVLISWDGDEASIFVDGKLDNTVSLSDPTQFAITAVTEGGELQDGTLAAGPRVNFPIENTGFASLTDDGLTLFDAALAWLVSNPSDAIPGDYNRDGVVDAADADAQSAAMKSANPDLATFDENDDSEVDGADRLIWVKTHAVEGNGTWVGDANLDGEFNSGDLVQVFAAGKYEQVGAMAGWAEGDWDGDMLFDSGDLVAAFSDGGYEQGPFMAAAAVPEPSSIALVMLGTTLLVLRRRRK